MNLVDILKRLRHLDIIMENSLLKNKDRVMKVQHTSRNVIDIDDLEPRPIPSQPSKRPSSPNRGSKQVTVPLPSPTNRRKQHYQVQEHSRESLSVEDFEGGEFARGSVKQGTSSKQKRDQSDSDSEEGNDYRLWYFTNDKNIKKIKYFETEIDENLKRAILFRHDFSQDPVVESSFGKSPLFKNVQCQTQRFFVQTFKKQLTNKISEKTQLQLFSWANAMEANRNFELKMLAFLSLLDHKNNSKADFRKEHRTIFKRTRGGARILAMNRF